MFAGRLDIWNRFARHSSARSFEPEAGQTDGTFYHALERWISLGNSKASGLMSCQEMKQMFNFGYKNSITLSKLVEPV